MAERITVEAVSVDELAVLNWPYGRRAEMTAIGGVYWSREDPQGWRVPTAKHVELRALLETADAPDEESIERVTNSAHVLAEALNSAAAASAGAEAATMAEGRMRRPLWEHQAAAVGAVEARWEAGRPGMLWSMAMGTGKSAAAAAVIDRMGGARVLILCPKSVVRVWPREIANALVNPPEVLALEQSSAPAKVSTLKRAANMPNVVVVANIECVRSMPVYTELRRQSWDLLICDESHRLKSPGGSDSKAVAGLAQRIPRRLGLTGTPMPHSPLDIFAQARILDEAVLGRTLGPFKARYAIMGGYGGKQIVAWRELPELARKLAGMTFSAGADVLDLPDIHHVDVDVVLSNAERDAYVSMYQDGVINLIDAGRMRPGQVTAASILAELVRLAQITGGSTGGVKVLEDGVVVQLEDPVQVGTSKRDRLLELVTDAGVSDTDPMVVFCRYRHSLAMVEEVAEAAGLTYGELSGSRRDGIDNDAYATEGRGLIGVQYQSGGVGIDLTRANKVACYDQTWSLGEFDQSMKRAHRPGQDRPVTVWHLLAGYDNRSGWQTTIDHRIRRAIDARRAFVNDVMAAVDNERGSAA